MASSGRMTRGSATGAVGVPIVILNETSKRGLLRKINIYNSVTGGPNAKIEIDGVVVYNANALALVDGKVDGSMPLGIPIQKNQSTQEVNFMIDRYSRVVNIPFTSSIKVSLIPVGAADITNYLFEYTLDV